MDRSRPLGQSAFAPSGSSFPRRRESRPACTRCHRDSRFRGNDGWDEASLPRLIG